LARREWRAFLRFQEATSRATVAKIAKRATAAA
jgi:hypothetical protein